VTRFRLQLLGFSELGTSDGAPVRSVIAQPKRLAILTYLVVNSGRQCSRDELIGVFWPERAERDARNALRQALHFLRKSLGHGVVLNLGDHQLRITPDFLDCDVVRFEQCIGSGDLEEALKLYGGDLAKGLHVGGCPEFDHWRDHRAAALRNSASAAAAALAAQAEADGAIQAAAEFTHRALQLDPFNEGHARALMRLLAESGDRQGSVVAFEAFRVHLQEALELEPSAETMELLSEIRANPPEEPFPRR